MYRELAIATFLSVTVLALSPLAVSAATTAPMRSATQVDNSLVQPVYDHWRDGDRHHWRYRHRRDWRDEGGWGYCRMWRHRCAERWGWGTWPFRRCLWRHGCGGDRRY